MHSVTMNNHKQSAPRTLTLDKCLHSHSAHRGVHMLSAGRHDLQLHHLREDSLPVQGAHFREGTKLRKFSGWCDTFSFAF